MTLPFKRDKEGGSMSGPVEVVVRKTDGEDKPFDFMDAIVDDFMAAIEKNDKRIMKDALHSLCNYIMDIDAGQDEEMMDQQ